MAGTAGNVWKWLDMAGSGYKQLEMSETAGNGWKWLEMAGNGWK